MKSVLKSLLRCFGIVILCLLTLVCGLLLFLSVTEYKPEPQSDAAHALHDQIPLSKN